MLNLKTYLVKEHVGMMKMTDTYDIFDATSGQQVGVAKEEISMPLKLLRLLVNKRLLPTTVNAYANGNARPVFSIRRGFTFLRSKVMIHDGQNNVLGYFKSKLLTLGGGFFVFDVNDKQFAEVKGDWKGWNFKLLTADGQELGTVAKKWAGLAKEMFTSADNYVIALSDRAAGNPASNVLLLAAGLAIDTIYKEKR